MTNIFEFWVFFDERLSWSGKILWCILIMYIHSAGTFRNASYGCALLVWLYCFGWAFTSFIL